MASLYSDSKTINIRKKLRENELGRIRFNSMMRHRVLMTGVFSMVVSIFLFYFLLLIMFKLSPVYLFTMPAVCAAAMIVISGVVTFYDIRLADKSSADFTSRPDWYKISTMLFYSLGIYLAVTFIAFQVIPYGLSAYNTTEWPVGGLLYLFIPVLVMIAYYTESVKVPFSTFDAFVVAELMLALYLLSYVCASVFKLEGSVVDSFCSLQSFLISIALIVVSVSLLYFIHLLNVKISDINKARVIDSGWKYPSHQEREMRLLFAANKRIKQSLLLIMNILVLLISVKSVADSLEIWHSTGWFTLPALISALLIPISIIVIPMNIRGIALASSNVYHKWYKYLSFIRCEMTLVNVAVAVTEMAVCNEKLIDVLSGDALGDGLTFLVCPVLSLLLIFMEIYDYSMRESMLCSLFCSIVVFLNLFTADSSVAGADIQNVSIFFSGTVKYAFIFIPFALGILIYTETFINVNDEKYRNQSIVVERGKGQPITFSVCGARENIAPTSPDYYEFGQASNCFVLRDGSYGLIIDCGSGMLNVSEKLKGCTNVDIILTNTNFPTLMGLLPVPNPCPDAKVRMFGPFGNGRNFVNMNEFAVPPLWPVNVIVGECISVVTDTDIPLNNLYSVRFTSANEQSTHYMTRISGAVNIAYTGAIKEPNENNMLWAKNCDLFIYNGKFGPETACSIADDIGAGYLLMANHDSFADDNVLNSCERQARTMFTFSDYARQGSEYKMI